MFIKNDFCNNEMKTHSRLFTQSYQFNCWLSYTICCFSHSHPPSTRAPFQLTPIYLKKKISLFNYVQLKLSSLTNDDVAKNSFSKLFLVLSKRWLAVPVPLRHIHTCHVHMLRVQSKAKRFKPHQKRTQNRSPLTVLGRADKKTFVINRVRFH